MHPYLSEEDVVRICDEIRGFIVIDYDSSVSSDISDKFEVEKKLR
jgi:hypothetical protein